MDSAVAGLRAHQSKLDVIGNNIANVNTFGFKAQTFTFKEANSTGGVLGTAAGTNGAQYGYGTLMGSIITDMTASTPSQVGGLNACLNAQGFFITASVPDKSTSMTGTDTAEITANIKGAGTDVIRIRGVRTLHGTDYSIIPDQIEAGTFMCAAAVTRGDITVKNVIPKHLEAISAKLIEIGCEVIEGDDEVRVVGRPKQCSTNIKTLPYPGFPTDMQPQMAVTLALAEGTSMITESIFENRFKYVDELARMGGNIKVEGNVAVIDGVRGFTGARVESPDLRAGAALVLAGLSAEGYTVVDEIGYIQRGYEKFEEKLQGLGAAIEMVDSEKEAQKFRLKIG